MDLAQTDPYPQPCFFCFFFHKGFFSVLTVHHGVPHQSTVKVKITFLLVRYLLIYIWYKIIKITKSVIIFLDKVEQQ